LRNRTHPTAPAATTQTAAAPTSIAKSITNSAAMTIRNASAGLSSTDAAIIEHCAQLGRVLMVSAPPEFTLPGHLRLEWLLTD
jgi:hypothetical protein